MKPKVLLVDDAAMARRAARQGLAGAGFDVLEAEDGIVALSQVAAHSDIVLIVCDLTMPRMSGGELLEQLRDVRCEIPVVVVTSDRRPEVVEQARSLGAVGWLYKPCSPDAIVRTARRFALLHSQRPGAIP